LAALARGRSRTLSRSGEHRGSAGNRGAIAALGLYHAQGIERIGAALAKLSWRVDLEAAEAHLRMAIRLTPQAPGAWLGLGLGLQWPGPKAHAAESTAVFDNAARMQPLDA